MIDERAEHTQAWTPDWDTWPIPAERRLPVLYARPAVDSPGRERHARGDRFGLGVLLGLLGAAAFASLFAAVLLRDIGGPGAAPATPTPPANTNSRGDAVAARTMPLLVGSSVDEALERLARVGLRARQQFRATTKATGKIVAQKPAGGVSARAGTPVLLVVDVGSPRVRVPDVRGLSAPDASGKLARLGFRVRRWAVASKQPAGTVLDQAPRRADTIPTGSVITLAVADHASVVVPDVISMSVVDARAALATRGLDHRIIVVASARQRGTVSSQHPPAGARVARDSRVVIAVSEGAREPVETATAPRAASVPELSGASLKAAVQQITELGLLVTIQYVPAGERPGIVLAQSPRAGLRAAARAHVTLNASRGSTETPGRTVPALVGKPLDEAVAAVNSAGLRLIYLKRPIRDRSRAGEVIEQTPRPGSPAPSNAHVLVYIGAFGSA